MCIYIYANNPEIVRLLLLVYIFTFSPKTLPRHYSGCGAPGQSPESLGSRESSSNQLEAAIAALSKHAAGRQSSGERLAAASSPRVHAPTLPPPRRVAKLPPAKAGHVHRYNGDSRDRNKMK